MIKTIIFPKKKYTVQECFGNLTTEELLETARSFFGGVHTPNIIWDFSLVRMINISPETIERLVDIWIKQNARRGGVKTAIIAPVDLEYSFSLLFGSISELNKATFETKIVSSLGEAKQWFFE